MRLIGLGLYYRVARTQPCLLALGIPANWSRLAPGHPRTQHTEENIDFFIKVFPPIVARLREMSPSGAPTARVSKELICTQSLSWSTSATANMGVIEDADGVGEVGNPQCGDMMRITIKVKDDVLQDIKFQTWLRRGCRHLEHGHEMAKGKKLDDAMEISNKAVAEALGGLPPAKMHCSNLAADGLQAAIEDYRNRQKAA